VIRVAPRIALALLALALPVSSAVAEPRSLRLRLRELPAPPPPRSLAMHRPLAAIAPPAPPPSAAARRRAPQRAATSTPGPTLRGRLDLGFAVDGARPSGAPTQAGGELASYAAVRPYAQGAAFLSTDGLIAAPLATYVALGFRLAPTLGAVAPLASSLDRTSDLQLRAAWGDAEHTLAGRVPSKVSLRAGRLYTYVVWPLHLDGAVASWRARGVSVELLAGYRVEDYRPTALDPRSPIGTAGGRVVVDLGRFGLPPTSLSVAGLQLGPRTLLTLGADHRIATGATARAEARFIDGAAARQQMTLRAALGRDAYLAFDVTNQAASDWRFDPSFISEDDPGAPRGYLELAAPAPSVSMIARSGLVVRGNLDVLLRGGASLTRQDTGDIHAGDWIEGGVATEVRVRRTLAIGASLLVRDTNRPEPPAVVDVAGPQVIELHGSGDESFVEGGVTTRIALGLRRLTATAEVYGRRVRFASRYVDEGVTPAPPPVQPAELRTGGRVTVDTWMTHRLRTRIAYDVTGAVPSAPEIAGYKSLRVTLEGWF
jgi:hypothetical protein